MYACMYTIKICTKKTKKKTGKN